MTPKVHTCVPRWGVALMLLALAALGLLFVPECDDCYFVFWRFDSWRDLLLTQPSAGYGPIMGVPENGRYLGNLLGILQAKLYFTPLGFLRGIGMGCALGAVVLLLERRMSRGGRVPRGEALALCLALVLLAPRGIWQQVYAWGAGMVNYLLPVVGLLVLAELLERGVGRPLPLALLSAACCLFLETVSIFCVVAGAVFVWASWSTPWRTRALWVCGGFWGGAALMFSDPGYRQGSGEVHKLALDLLGENFQTIVVETLVFPLAVTVCISVLLVWLVRRQGGRIWLPAGAALTVVHLMQLGVVWDDLNRTASQYSSLGMALGLVLAALWVVLLAVWNGGRDRLRVIVLALSLCVLNGPLLVVSPLVGRNFFPSYGVLLLTAAVLYRRARAQGFPPLTRLALPLTAAALCGLFWVYGSNCRVYHQRLDYAQTQVQAGAQTVTLPLVPFPGWTVDEEQGKGDISYLVYRQSPWDVTFTFVPWGWEDSPAK